MPNEPGGDRPDTKPAFDPRVFQPNAFQTRRERFFGALSLTFAGIVYTALIAVAGVVVATIPAHRWVKFAVVVAYVLLALALFWWGVTKGRDWVIARSRKVLRLPSDRG